MRCTTRRAAWRFVAAALLVVAAGCGSSSPSGSGLCNDFAELANVHGTDQATLHKAADLYRKVADDAPSSVQDDLRTLATDEDEVAAGHASSVDNNAAEAAARRADAAISAKCANK